MNYGRVALAPITQGDTYRPWYFDAIDDSDLPYNGFDGAVIVGEIRTSLGALVYAYTSLAGTASAEGQRVSFSEIDAAVTATLVPGNHRFSVRVTRSDGVARSFLEPQNYGLAVTGVRHG